MTVQKQHLLKILKFFLGFVIEIFWGTVYCSVILVSIFYYHFLSDDLKFSLIESVKLSENTYADIGKSVISVSQSELDPYISVKLSNIYIRDPKDRICAQFDKINLKVNPLNWLIYQKIYLEEVYLEKPNISMTLTNDQDNEVKCSLGRLQVPEKVLQDLFLSDGDTDREQRKKFQIYNGAIDLLTDYNEQSWYFGDLNLIATHHKYWLYDISYSILHEGKEFNIHIEGDYDKNRRLVAYNKFDFDAFPPDKIALIHPSLEFMKLIQIPISGEVKTILNQNLEVDTLDFDISSAGPGLIESTEFKNYLTEDYQTFVNPEYSDLFEKIDIYLNGLKIKGKFDLRAQKYEIEDFELSFDDGLYINPLSDKPIPILDLKTNLTYYQNSSRVVFHKFWMNFTGQSFEIQNIYENPVTLKLLAFKGWIDFKHNHFVVTDTYSDFIGPTFATKLSLYQTPTGYTFTSTGAVLKLPVNDLPQLWPREKSVNAREWVVENILDGEFARINFSLSFSMDRAFKIQDFDQVEVSAWLRNFEIDYINSLPTIKDVDAFMKLNTKEATFYIDHGKIEDITLNKANVYLLDFVKDIQRADIWVELEGKVQNFMRILTMEPMQILGEYPLAKKKITGDAVAVAAFRFPLLKDVRLDDLFFDVDAQIKNGKIPDLIDKYDIKNGNFQLLVTENDLKAKGSANLENIKTTFELENIFSDEEEWPVKVKGRTKLDVENLKSIDIDFTDYAKGEAEGSFEYKQHKDSSSLLALDLDVSETEVDIYSAFPKKEKGTSARLKTTLFGKKGKDFELRDLLLESNTHSFKGDAVFSEKGFNLKEFTIDEFSYDKTKLSGKIKYEGEKPFVDLKVNYWDIRPLIKKMEEFSVSGENELSPFELLLQIDKAQLENGVAMDSLNVKAKRARDKWDYLEVKGKIREFQNQFIIDREKSAPSLNVNIHNLGLFLKGLNFTDVINEGNLAISGRYSSRAANARLSGNIFISKYFVKNIPGLLKLINATSIIGIGDAFAKKGVEFSDLSAKFNLQNDVLSLSDGQSSGRSLGLTFEGIINLTTTKLNLKGVIVPAYAVNGFVNRIPLIGAIVGGGKDEGLFALNYKLVGKWSDPDVKTNPLSVITPGFLRKIFGQ